MVPKYRTRIAAAAILCKPPKHHMCERGSASCLRGKHTNLEGLLGLPDLQALSDTRDYIQSTVERHLPHKRPAYSYNRQANETSERTNENRRFVSLVTRTQ